MIATITSQKGGVGKTTTAVSLAHGIALAGYRTVLADLDSQAHAAISLGLDPEPGIFNHLVVGMAAADCLVSTNRPGFQLLPGNSRTKSAQTFCQVENLGAGSLAKALKGIVGLAEALIVDTAASGLFQEAAIAAADVLIIPVRLEALGLDGVAATIQAAQKLNERCQIIILPTAMDKRVKEHSLNLGLLHNAYPGFIAEPIPQRISVAEACAEGRTIWEHPTNGAADAYQALVDRVLTTVLLDEDLLEIEEA
ncbi:MAG: ParA family protein [Caldilineaceae bacterium]